MILFFRFITHPIRSHLPVLTSEEEVVGERVDGEVVVTL